MASTCLFLINGLGLGNGTRCHAVMEHLVEAGCQIHVVTSGNGLAYFKERDFIQSLTPMESLEYSGRAGGISGWSTLQSLPALLRKTKVKRNQLRAVLRQINPDVAIVDSEYVLGPVRDRGVPIIGLNTSEIVVSEYHKHRRSARGTRSHFWFVEFSDYLFHRKFCDLVLSPFPLRTPTRHPKFRRVGLILRQAIRVRAAERKNAAFLSPRQLRTVVFMLSGSVHASRIDFNHHQLPFKVEVVGRDGESRGNVTYHGRRVNNVDLLFRADALVINGGYSAVSEAFLLRKPVFVIPVPGHAEQLVNACLVRDLGVGFMATEENVLEQMMGMHQADRWSGLSAAPPEFEFNGAQEAAEVILASGRNLKRRGGVGAYREPSAVAE
jgi:hypothetical protein